MDIVSKPADGLAGRRRDSPRAREPEDVLKEVAAQERKERKGVGDLAGDQRVEAGNLDNMGAKQEGDKLPEPKAGLGVAAEHIENLASDQRRHDVEAVEHNIEQHSQPEDPAFVVEQPPEILPGLHVRSS
jgi:hypothetical protein